MIIISIHRLIFLDLFSFCSWFKAHVVNILAFQLERRIQSTHKIRTGELISTRSVRRMRWVLQSRSRPAIELSQQIMPSRASSTGRPKVDRSTSPLSRKPATSSANPVQELKAVFAEPTSNELPALSNGEKESDFRFEAIQCLRQSSRMSIIKMRLHDLPDRGNWSSKVRYRTT